MDVDEHAIACAKRGDLDFFKTVAPEILLNAIGGEFDDKTVLTVAALEGHLDCCEIIVERCPQLLYHQDSNMEWSVLHWVVDCSWKDNNRENIMRFLLNTADSKPDLELGGGPKIPNYSLYSLLKMRDRDGWTALHLAVDKRNHGATKLLLEADRGFQLLRMVNDDGKTCLHFAVEKGELDTVKLICEADVDKQLLSMPDEDNNTPLHLAVEDCDLEMVRLLIEGDSVTVYCAVNNSKKTPLSMAMDKAARYGSGSDSEVICKVLLESDWTKVVDCHGQNAVHVAAYHGHLAVVHHFFESKDTDVVALFTRQDKDGNTPLHLAVYKGNVQVVRLLLEAPQISEHKATNISTKTPYMMGMGKILSHKYGECSKSDLELGGGGERANRFLTMQNKNGDTALHLATQRMLSDIRGEHSDSGSKIVHMLLEKDPKQCIKLVETHKQTFIHAAVKYELTDVVKNILKSKEIEGDVLNIQDNDGNTPLHIAALGPNKHMTKCLLYDARVSKEIENNKKEKAIDLINFSYDEAKAKVYSLGHQIDLKDQSSFDLLVATLIATVSFTAGITVPGGYVSDGTNKGSAILLKATAFKVFVVSNNFALLFSLYTVFLNFSTRRLLKKDDIYYESKTGTFRARLQRKKDDMIYQFNTATLCTLSAIYAMVVAFITGSYAVLANSDGLAITVCVCSCFFLILASHSTWTMVMQYWREKVEPEVSS